MTDLERIEQQWNKLGKRYHKVIDDNKWVGISLMNYKDKDGYVYVENRGFIELKSYAQLSDFIEFSPDGEKASASSRYKSWWEWLIEEEEKDFSEMIRNSASIEKSTGIEDESIGITSDTDVESFNVCVQLFHNHGFFYIRDQADLDNAVDHTTISLALVEHLINESNSLEDIKEKTAKLKAELSRLRVCIREKDNIDNIRNNVYVK